MVRRLGERVLAMAADTALALPGLILVLLIVALLPGQYAPIYLGFALAPAAFPPRVTLRQSLLDLTARAGMAWSAVETLLARLRLAPHLLDRRPDQVSGGELQRIALLRILLIDPALIFADEATSRLDPITQQETIDVLLEQSEQRGCAVLMVTHDVALASNVCGSRRLILD